MSLKLEFPFRFRAYEDESPNNDPKKVLLDYGLSVFKELTNAGRYDTDIPALGTITIPMPATPCSFLFIVTDGHISAILDGSLTDNHIQPSSIGTKDGYFIKRGQYSTLTIKNLYSSVANTSVFMGV